MKNNTTTAARLLALVFEGHSIRTVIQDGNPLFVAKDVLDAAEIKATRDAYRRLKDYERVSTQLDTLGGKQTMVCLTESGVYHVLFSSQKPAAENLRRWLAVEVLPQLLKYGTFIEGATTGERCAALRARWLMERGEAKAAGLAAMDGSGLLSIRAFRQLHAIPEVLRFSAALQAQARRAGYSPERFYTGTRRHTPAWPLHLLEAAHAIYCQPREITAELFELTGGAQP